jgi:hypothetical protein
MHWCLIKVKAESAKQGACDTSNIHFTLARLNWPALAKPVTRMQALTARREHKTSGADSTSTTTSKKNCKRDRAEDVVAEVARGIIRSRHHVFFASAEG